MAHRGLLHVGRVPAFIAWACGRGWRTAPTVGTDEVLRLVSKSGVGAVLVLTKRQSSEHVTASGAALAIVKAFIGKTGPRR